MKYLALVGMVLALSAGGAAAQQQSPPATPQQQTQQRPGVPERAVRRPMHALGFTCNPLFCSCTGDADCNDMFTTNLCGDRDICIDNVCYCIRR